MALPPLPENNTARLFITYTSGGGSTAQEHTLSIRYNPNLAQPFDIMDVIGQTMAAGLRPQELFTGWQVIRAETQAAGAQVRLPVSVPASLLNFVGQGTVNATPSEQAREVRFVGRGLTSGRRVTLSLYGVSTASITEQDFRFTPAPGGLLAGLQAYALSVALTGAAFTAIDGGPTNWYSYVNWQYNSHWETEQRA